MARKITKQDPGENQFNTDELKRVLAAAADEAGKAKEHNAEAGSIVREGLDTLGIDRKSFAMVRGLHKLSDEKRQASFRDFLKMAIALGWLDQTDAFDDVGDLLAAALGYQKPKLRAVS